MLGYLVVVATHVPRLLMMPVVVWGHAGLVTTPSPAWHLSVPRPARWHGWAGQNQGGG